ncbi:MAG: hypothetical protein EOP00_31195 [Pedobacter sp.]|nr:MAG: hypothetical protein EOP00_31195 [Pedobacter sp.]
MKKLAALFIALFSFIVVYAQTEVKNDVILKLNGDELKGKITQINDTEVKFIYAGETLEYTIKKADIFRITHNSGRVELINSPNTNQNQAVASTQNNVDRRNKIAILPFAFIRDSESSGEEMSYKVQNEAYAYLTSHSVGYTILDPRTTDALLIKAGITRDKMAGFTMDEICKVLGVEYIIDGTVSINKGVATSSTSGGVTIKKENDQKTKASNSSSTVSAQTYITTITLNVFNDKNTSLFNETHRALLASTDGSYAVTLHYLLKRTPFYKK